MRWLQIHTACAERRRRKTLIPPNSTEPSQGAQPGTREQAAGTAYKGLSKEVPAVWVQKPAKMRRGAPSSSTDHNSHQGVPPGASLYGAWLWAQVMLLRTIQPYQCLWCPPLPFTLGFTLSVSSPCTEHWQSWQKRKWKRCFSS